MYVLCDCADIFFFNSMKKKQSRNFFESKKLFSECICKLNFLIQLLKNYFIIFSMFDFPGTSWV